MPRSGAALNAIRAAIHPCFNEAGAIMPRSGEQLGQDFGTAMGLQ